MQQLATLFKLPIIVNDRRTERGEFLKRFSNKMGYSIGRIAKMLQGIPTEDLYFIEKQCNNYNGAWGKAFNGMLKVR